MRHSIIPILFTIVLFTGCIEDTLDRKPLNRISDGDVWESEQMIDLYLVNLYANIQVGFENTNASSYETHATDESAFQYTGVASDFGNTAIAHNTTMYSYIRRVNYAIERIKTAKISEALMTRYIAEFRFIRAYYYFQLVKRYGGMPIIESVQNFGGDIEELQRPRDTEDAVYQFILNELNLAIADLPDSRNAENANRATKLVAQALKSRAMLYAGSIAKYGTVQLDGLVGIPSSKAAAYFTESMNASKVIMESNRFGLYDSSYDPSTKSGDPITNYQQLFLDKNNKEVIFQKAYSFPDFAHSLDNRWIPYGFTTSFGSQIAPYLDLVESYEYVDGSPGILNVEGKEFDSPLDAFKNKDPRFYASIFYPGAPYIGRDIQIHKGVYDTDGTLYETEHIPFPKDRGVLQVGLDGPYLQGNGTRTGFYIRKFLNPSRIVIIAGQSDQNYIDFRYAEILLNYCEAALELQTNLPQALDAINQVRNRAGIKLLGSNELTIDRLRNERKVELAFEDKRFWDIKRWRIGEELFRNTYMEGLFPYLKYDGSSYKYIFKRFSGFPILNGLPRVWEQRDYYSDLSSYISTSNIIRNNPGW